MYQVWTVGSGNYWFAWNVTLDGNVIASFNPPAGATNYVDYNASFTAMNHAHTITFKGTDLATGDNTFFFDIVRLALVTSPVPPMLASFVRDSCRPQTLTIPYFGDGAATLSWYLRAARLGDNLEHCHASSYKCSWRIRINQVTKTL